MRELSAENSSGDTDQTIPAVEKSSFLKEETRRLEELR
jgi:hypothetical protein